MSDELKRKIGLANSGSRGGISMTERQCVYCAETFKVSTSYMKYNQKKGRRPGTFCSRDCRSKSIIGVKFSAERRKRLSEAHMGVKMPPRSPEYRRKLSEARKGQKSHFWKGGVSIENKLIRASVEFRLWREAVFARDNWTCQKCGVRGTELHPHHIKAFASFPELRFAIDNGMTLCAVCHRQTENYGIPHKEKSVCR